VHPLIRGDGVDVSGLAHGNSGDGRRCDKPLHHRRQRRKRHGFLIPEKDAEAARRHEQVPSERVRPNLNRRALTPRASPDSLRLDVLPVLKERMSQLVREAAALPHRIAGSRDPR